MTSAPVRTPPTPAVRNTQYAVLADACVAVAFALAVIVTRWPVRSRRVFNWDAANFVLAVRDYDVRLHHPHPPGYPVFVAMGWLVGRIVPDANTALVIVAMLLAAGAVSALYWLGRTLYDRPTGILAALFLLFSVTFWTNGAVALAYPSLALFGTLVALFAWRLRSSKFQVPSSKFRGDLLRSSELGTWNSLLLSAAYALGGGFRPDLLLFLAPLWLWGHWQAGWRVRLTGAAVVVAIVSAWAVPMIARSGGLEGYLTVLRAYTADDVLRRYSVAENGPRALIVNVRDLLTYTGYALYALALPVMGAAVWFVIAGVWRLKQGKGSSRTAPTGGIRHATLFYALWIMPMLLFYTWVHIGDPGYVLTFVPALLLLTAHAVMKVTSHRYRGAKAAGALKRYLLPATCYLLIAVVLTTNAAIFLTRPLALTAPGIVRQDRIVDAKIAYVRAHGDPADTLLVSYESYRQWLVYLPEYRIQFVDVTYGTEADRTLAIPPGVARVVLMDDTLLRAAQGVTPTDVAPIERDRVGVLHAPPSPVRFAPVASPFK